MNKQLLFDTGEGEEEEMYDEKVVQKSLVEKEGISSILEEISFDDLIDTEELENRWKNKLDAVFSYFSRAVSRFFVSRVKSEEVAQIQFYIRKVFRKTDYIDKIKSNGSFQYSFLLGYCHGIDKMIDSFEAGISFQQNESLKAAIRSYKYVEPTLRILDNNIEISHKELAKQLDISEPALSNFMNKVQSYRLFNSTRVGKNKYYSLAYPNGEEALKIIKEDNSISADSYTEFLILLMDSLKKISICDELEQDYVVEKCEKMIRQFTTKPAICIGKLKDLALIAKSERVYRNSLMVFEMNVKEKVTVFTKDIMSEQSFSEVIIENLKKDIIYQWFITETEEFNSKEKVQKFFIEQFLNLNERNNIERFKRNVYCHIIPKEKTDLLLGNIYDAVIYDENEGFTCEDDTISDETPYIEMQQSILEKFNQYVREQSNFLINLAIG